MSTPDSVVAIFRVVDVGNLASLELRVASFGAAAMLGELVAGQQVELRLVPTVDCPAAGGGWPADDCGVCHGVPAVEPVASESVEAGR